MAELIYRHRLSWDPFARRGEVAFLAKNSAPVRISVMNAEEFNALALILKGPNVVWNGRFLQSDFGSHALIETEGIELLEINPTAQKIIDACEDEWPTNKDDCSRFVKIVAENFGVNISGQANNIIDQITTSGWTKLADGKAAKKSADEGKFVIGGLKGSDLQVPSDHGHVVIVVSGPLAKDQYPTAYWGTLGGVGERAKTINWAWKSIDRDRVYYAARSI